MIIIVIRMPCLTFDPAAYGHTAVPTKNAPMQTEKIPSRYTKLDPVAQSANAETPHGTVPIKIGQPAKIAPKAK
jgi:hypothetical protein